MVTVSIRVSTAFGRGRPWDSSGIPLLAVIISIEQPEVLGDEVITLCFLRVTQQHFLDANKQRLDAFWTQRASWRPSAGPGLHSLLRRASRPGQSVFSTVMWPGLLGLTEGFRENFGHIFPHPCLTLDNFRKRRIAGSHGHRDKASQCPGPPGPLGILSSYFPRGL